jgi:tetratricopeptide (TPR) repeat protein
MNSKLWLLTVCGILFLVFVPGQTAYAAGRDANAVKEYLAEAENLAKEYKYDDALKIIDKALEIEPKNEQVLLLQLDVLISLNRADDALKANDIIIALFPNNSDYLIGKLFLAAKMGRFDVVLKLWDDPRILSIMHTNPNDAFVWIKKSESLMRMRRYNEAIKALEKARELDPNKGQEVSRKLQMVKEIAKNPVLKTQENDPNFKTKAREYWANEALKVIEKAPAIDTDNETVMKKQFRTYMAADEVNEGLKICDKLAELDPNNYNRQKFREMVLTKFERWEEALKAADILIQLKPNDAGAFTSKGQSLMELGRNEEALNALDRATVLDPNSSDAWGNKGAVQARMKNYDQAIVSYNRAVKMFSPYNIGRFIYERACVYAQKNDKTNAIADLNRAIELHPDFKEQAKKDDNFKSLQNDPDFKKLTD